MIFTNLEKYVYSNKCLKQGRQPLTPPSSKVEGICHLATAQDRGPTGTHPKQGLWLDGKTMGMVT